VGAIIISRRGASDAAGKPKDVDREFVCLFMLFDENQSWYLDYNIQTYTSDPKGVNRGEFIPVDADGNLAPAGTGFSVANGKFAINGYIYGTGPVMTMKKGERVLMQAQMVTVDMVPDDPGTWMFHCHLDDHMEAGMMAFYKVEP
jgi:hephaestin